MTEHPDDALKRFDFARQQLAQIDAAVHRFQLQAHVNGARLSSGELDQVCGLLIDLGEGTENFRRAALALAEALANSESHA